MSAVEEYRGARCNDLNEDPAFEQGRSFLRDYADDALAELEAENATLEAMLLSAVNEWFEEEGGPAGYFEDRELYLLDLRALILAERGKS